MTTLLLVTVLPLLTSGLLTDEDATFKLALSSPAALTSLLSSHLANYPELKYTDRGELRKRARVFKRELRKVEKCNTEEQFHCGINRFSTMSDDERSLFLGLSANTTGPLNASPQPLLLQSVSSKDWRTSGAVTSVKDQGSCGSCWAYAGIGSLEGAYAAQTGVLKSFSVQEMLECTYEHFDGYDGCGGGWYFDAFDYMKRTGHMTTRVELPYEGRDSGCRPNYPNGLIAAEVSGYVQSTKDDWGVAAAITVAPTAVAMYVAGEFFSYSNGVYDGRSDCYNAQYPNHALTAVGFTPSVFVVKNSWGGGWGEQGFVRVQRGYDVCMINQNAMYPTLKSTGKQDNSKGDEDEDGGDKSDCGGDTTDCTDLNSQYCPGVAYDGNCYKDYMLDYAFQYCKLSCKFCNNSQNLVDDCSARIAAKSCGDEVVKGLCPGSCCKGDDDNGGCPSGTTLCPDGQCKHVHMC